MFVELHLIQNFAPSNLNRDDTGSPKDCQFGGYRRARISSQCLKRAVRTYVKDHGLVAPEDLATRTKRLVDGDGGLVSRMTLAGRSEAEARAVATAALAGAELKLVEQNKTQYLLFLGEREIAALANLCLTHWDALLAAAPPVTDPAAPPDPDATTTAAPAPRPNARQAKKAGRDALSAELQTAIKAILDGGRAADLALFGRMLADLPERNIDAACQVAHALSTHTAGIEFDYYTAVDDLKPNDTAGADMIGTVEFNSACFYRYANIDIGQLATKNLGGDTALARQALRAFLTASIHAIPTGKQNSMAAQNPPSFIFATVRDHGLWSLANAFVTPVRQDGGTGLVGKSILALDDYWGQLAETYGDDGIRLRVAAGSRTVTLAHLENDRVSTAAALIARVCDAAFGPTAEAEASA